MWRSVSFQQRFSIKLQFTSSGLRSPSQGKKQNLHRRRVIIPCKRYLIIRKVNQITLNEVKEANFMWTCARVCELVAAFSATCICYVFPAMPTRTQKGQRVTVPQVHGRWYTCTGSASFRTFTYIFASGLEEISFHWILPPNISGLHLPASQIPLIHCWSMFHNLFDGSNCNDGHEVGTQRSDTYLLPYSE